MKILTLIHKILTNPETINEKGWKFAEYEFKEVAVKIMSDEYFERYGEDLLEESFDNSQNLEESWTSSNFFFDFNDDDCHSTKTGDYVRLDNKLFLVDMIGFTEVEHLGDTPEGVNKRFFF